MFKTITDETTLSGQRIVGALQARKIAQQQATAQLQIDIACLNEYQIACQKGIVSTEQFDKIMNKASVSATEYTTKIKAGTGSAQSYATAQRATNTALQEVSIGAGIASKAVKLLSVTFNMIAFTAFINGVSWLIGKVDEWIVTADEAKESADAFKESLSSFFDETQSNLKTITSLSDRFDELSKNVDANGNQIGGTTEEYDEFLGICEQVGQIMPELITGYTNEGQAIITLRSEVDSLTESYENAIRAKAALFLSNGDDEGNTIDSFFDDYNNFVQGNQGFLGLKTSPSGQNTAEEFERYYGYDKVHGWLSDVTDATLEDLQNLRAGTTEYVYLARVLKEAGYEISEISADNYNAIHDVFNSRMTVMEQGITDRVTNIKNAFQNMLYADSEYWEIDDNNIISAINSVYASIDDEFIKQNNLFSKTALQTFESDLVSLFTNDATKQAMLNFYAPMSEDETVKEYTDRVTSALNTVQTYCNENGIVIPIEIGDSSEGVDSLVNNVKEKLKGTEFDDKVGELSLGDLKIASELNVPLDSIESWEELFALIQKVKDETFNNKIDIQLNDIFSLEDAESTITNLGKISESIDTIQNAYKTLNNAIDEYNENGSFSIDTLQSVIALGDDWLDYLVDENGNLQLDKESLQELTQARLNDMRVQTINNLIDNVKKIETDADANEYLKSTNYALAESYEEVSQKALESARAKMQDAVASGKLSQANMNAAMSKATADIAKINKLFANADITSVSSLSGGSGSGSSKSTKKEYEELFDFFERRIDVLNDSLDLLKSNMENINGASAKNNLLNAQSSIYQEEIRNYTDALAMYQHKANEVLSNLPDDIAEKVKNGAVDLTTFMGESSEVVVDAIKDYEGWSDKIADCSKQLAELKETLRDLELEKFNNIVEDFTSQFDLRQTGIDNISKQVALFEEMGQLIGESFYVSQKEQAEKQLAILKEQQLAMANQLSSALASGSIQRGTDEWVEMVGELQNVEGQILDCEKSIEEFSNAILDINWQVFERIQDTFSNLDSELNNLVGLLDDIDVANDFTGGWNDEAIAKLGLLSQQYELAQYGVESYNDAIAELQRQYANGNYSAIEYADKLSQLIDEQWEYANSAESAKDAIVDLNEARVDEVVEGINKEIEAYKELIDAKISALDAEKDLNEYRDTIEDKTKSVTNIERQLAAMSNDDSLSAIAKRKQLEESLVDAKKDLEKEQYSHSIEQQKSALEKQFEEYEEARNSEIESLESSLNDQEKLISDSFETVKQNASTVGQQISTIAKKHGVQVSNSLTSSWKQGENAIASYGTILSAQSSAFIGNIMGVENEVWSLQAQANNTANTLAYMFSTQADNLVNELSQSYYAESNLMSMTNALQSSLINTLERGYDVSKITSALKGIEDAANSAAGALRNMQLLQANQKWYVIDSKTNEQLSNGFDTQEEAKKYLNKNASIFVRNGHTSPTLAKYASGVHNLTKDELAWTQEVGREMILSPSRDAVLTPLKSGDTVLTKVQTDNIFDWSKINPNILVNQFATPSVAMPKFEPRSVTNTPSLHLDKLIHIDKVDGSNIKQMESIANKAVNNLVDKLYNGKKYGSY